MVGQARQVLQVILNLDNMLVKYKPTGQLGDIPDDKFDPNLFEVASPTPTSLPQMPAPTAPPVQRPQVQAQMPSMPKPKSVEGFAANVGTSAVKNVKDIGSSLINIVNPDMEKNTLANLARLGVDVAKLAAGDKNEQNRAKQVFNFYKERYGGLDKLAETAYNDPVGVALDASTVLGGGAAALKGTAAVTRSAKIAKVADTVSDVSRAIDPLQQATKLVGKGVGKTGDVVADVTKKPRIGAAESIATRSTKASASQLEKFKDLTGQDVGKFMVDNGVYTMDDAEKAIKPLQKTYNEMVRTGQKVSGVKYADNLRKKAIDILSEDHSEGARKLADKLWDEADVQEKIGDVTDTVLTNTKSNTFNKVTDKSMTDPLSDNFNKQVGAVGIETLDEIAKGSAAVGKQLQALREFQHIAKKQTQLGKGTQVLNILKPSVAGAAAGSFIPGVGNLTGAGIGAVGSAALSSPGVQRTVAKTLATGEPLAKVGAGIGNMAQVGYDIAKSDRMQSPSALPPMSQSTPTQSPIDQPLSPDVIAMQEKALGGTQPSPDMPAMEQPIHYRTGRSPDEHAEAYTNAVMDGNTKAATQIKELYDMEVAYQKENSPESKDKGQETLDNALVGVEELKRLYGVGTDQSLSMGKDTVGLSGVAGRGGIELKKLNNQSYVDRLNAYKNATAFAAGLLNQARGAGTLNAGEFETMIANMPNEYSSETQAEAWFKNIESIVKRMSPTAPAQAIVPSDSLPTMSYE